MRQRDGDASCLFRNRIKFLLWNAIILSSIHSFIYTIIVIMLSSMSNIYWFRFRTAIYGIIIIKIHIREFCFSFVFCLSLAGHEMSTLDNWFVHLPRACISLTSANTIDVIFFIAICGGKLNELLKRAPERPVNVWHSNEAHMHARVPGLAGMRFVVTSARTVLTTVFGCCPTAKYEGLSGAIGEECRSELFATSPISRLDGISRSWWPWSR